MTIAELVQEFYTLRAPGWLTLSEQESLDAAVRAARRYAGYGSITSIPAADAKNITSVTSNTELTISEWAVISPLFVLYLEFDNAQRLEASRQSGLDPWGRNSETIGADIVLAEDEFMRRAFMQPVRILGINGGDELPLPPVMQSCLY